MPKSKQPLRMRIFYFDIGTPDARRDGESQVNAWLARTKPEVVERTVHTDFSALPPLSANAGIQTWTWMTVTIWYV